MPTVDDYDAEDEQDGGASSGGGGSAFAGGGGQTMYGGGTPQQEKQFVPWSRFVSANQDVSNREAGKLTSQVTNDVNAVTSARDSAAKANEDAIRSNYAGYEKPKPGQAQAGAFVPSNAADSGHQTQPGAFNQGGDTLSSFTPEPAPPEQRQRSLPSMPKTTGQMGGGFVPGGSTWTPPVSSTGNSYMPTPKQHALNPMSMANADYLVGAINPDKLWHNPETDKTQGFGLAGSPDLESQLGKDAWAKLLGDTSRAQGEANALGSESGVQALIQQQNAGPLAMNGAFDAALINGAGGSGFRDLAKQYGGDKLTSALTGANQAASSRWSKLMGDVGRAGSARDKMIQANTEEQNRLAAERNTSQGGSAAPGASTGSGWHPEGYEDLNSFLHPDVNDFSDFDQYMHQAGQMLSPADWLTRGLGELGYSGPGATEAFAGSFAGGAAPKGDWAQADMRTAMQQVQSEYGNEAMQYFWGHLTPEMWDEYMHAGNPGNMARLMRAWLESAGYSKHAQNASLEAEKGTNKGGSEVMNAGYASGEADQGTTAEQETARNQAYAEGWGSSYDEQWRNGNKNPQKP